MVVKHINYFTKLITSGIKVNYMKKKELFIAFNIYQKRFDCRGIF